MHKLVVRGCASLGVEHGDLLKTGVKITTYGDHFGLLPSLTLVSKPTTVYGLRA
jgi:hypothetical protein